MISDQQPPRGVHLNGSIPLANADEVFRVTSSILGERLHRIPDGGTDFAMEKLKVSSRACEHNDGIGFPQAIS